MSGGPDLGNGLLRERLQRLRTEFDGFRSGVVNEPRGSDITVGALLCEPADSTCVAGVIFFNNVGYLGMCGHGTIGLVVTLAYSGKIGPGEHRIATPVGIVTATLHSDNQVTVKNILSYRHATKVALDVPGHGVLHGDIAWGGNWFFITEDHGQQIRFRDVEKLTEFAWRVRRALAATGITGADGGEIDHIELLGPPEHPEADAKNFVLCPGKAFDRSPCGTGTSAKLACLYADGKLKEGDTWRQEGIVGTLFEGSFTAANGGVYPSIKGSAFVNAEADLIFDPRDPFSLGIRA